MSIYEKRPASTDIEHACDKAFTSWLKVSKKLNAKYTKENFRDSRRIAKLRRKELSLLLAYEDSKAAVYAERKAALK